MHIKSSLPLLVYLELRGIVLPSLNTALLQQSQPGSGAWLDQRWLLGACFLAAGWCAGMCSCLRCLWWGQGVCDNVGHVGQPMGFVRFRALLLKATKCPFLLGWKLHLVSLDVWSYPVSFGTKVKLWSKSNTAKISNSLHHFCAPKVWGQPRGQLKWPQFR